MPGLCAQPGCQCAEFTQSAFSGYTNIECSTCHHTRHEHLNGWALDHQLRYWPAARARSMTLKLLRIASGRAQEPSKPGWFRLRSVPASPPSYLFLLPNELLGMVAGYFSIIDA